MKINFIPVHERKSEDHNHHRSPTAQQVGSAAEAEAEAAAAAEAGERGSTTGAPTVLEAVDVEGGVEEQQPDQVDNQGHLNLKAHQVHLNNSLFHFARIQQM